MLLHLGDNVAIPLERVLFVLNGRNMTAATKAYVDRARKERRYVRCTGKPKAYVAVLERTREVLYESLIASSTLQKRWQEETERKYLFDNAVVMTELMDQ